MSSPALSGGNEIAALTGWRDMEAARYQPLKLGGLLYAGLWTGSWVGLNLGPVTKQHVHPLPRML